MGKLYGYKRWYDVEVEVENNKGEKRKVEKKVRVKREYENNNYVIKRKDNNNKIDNNEFIEKLIEYKKENKIKEKFDKKFHIGNILFKLKLKNPGKKGEIVDLMESKDIINDVVILSRTKKLSKIITRKNLQNELKKQIENGNLKKETKDIEIKIKDKKTQEKKIKINIEYNAKNLNREREKYILSWKKIDVNERKIKEEVYDKFKKINEKLYTLIRNILTNEISGSLEKRNYREYLKLLFLKKEAV